ncbi:MAG: hypothetical protein K2Q21_06500 [Chitinophagaceae bacterium]|nr:hypothetical protein [Chitinophagaceae bacterium]
MENATDIWQFLEENKRALNEYIELQIQIFNLKFIRKSATISGVIIWVFALLLLLLVILLFAGLTLSFWLTNIFNSPVVGFGITTGVFIVISLIFIVARKQLFINPMIRIIIRAQTKDHE